MIHNKQYWYFTFGSKHRHHNRYVKIFGTKAHAAAVMLLRFPKGYGFQFPDAKSAGVMQFNLKEII